MSLYAEASKEDRQKIRKAMLVEADKILKPLYHATPQRHAAARVIVDRALAQAGNLEIGGTLEMATGTKVTW